MVQCSDSPSVPYLLYYYSMCESQSPKLVLAGGASRSRILIFYFEPSLRQSPAVQDQQKL
ncbi:hypothetical protein PSHT_09078 [Puccinia striiformis]|uniref:Uncharacterized protein n=1 Tax=Puccinia striiformis TaxID=27350 RepID=A0A2S4VJ63_9BASI|nr:hypothetical protein PSHT_09078 [Puccinia striiformis]